MRSAMSPRKMPTTVRKGNRCTIEVSGEVVRAISIAQHKRNAKAVHKRSYVLQVPIGLFVHWQEPARQAVRALAGTPEYKHSQRARYKVEALFAELKQQIKLRRVRLRRLWNVAEQFHLAATAQNLKRLVGRLAQRQMPEPSTT